MHPSHSVEPSPVVVKEYGQGEQDRARWIEEVVPTSHARHGWPASGLNQPASHSTHVSPSASVPGSQGEQRLRSAFETSPPPHVVHDDEPPLEAEPAVHDVHNNAPSVEKVPAPQVTHSTLPMVAACLPAEQP